MIEKQIWDSARGNYQSQKIEDLTEELEAEVADLEETYIEVMTEFAGNCTPQIKERRAQIESAYGRAALLLKLLSPDPVRYWEVFGPWSDVELR
jgi:hypothetical protein